MSLTNALCYIAGFFKALNFIAAFSKIRIVCTLDKKTLCTTEGFLEANVYVVGFIYLNTAV